MPDTPIGDTKKSPAGDLGVEKTVAKLAGSYAESCGGTSI